MADAETVFTLEAVFAKKGDALLLHYGAWDRPNWILIDGGPRGVYSKFLHPRLDQLKEEFELEQDEPIPLSMVMVSHADDDHIAGVIDLFEDIEEAKDANQPVPYKVDTLWHNSFDDILGNQGEEIVSRMAATAASTGAPDGLLIPRMSRESRAVVASTAQGRDLRNIAKRLRVKVNNPFEGLIMAPAEKAVTFADDLSFTVIGPSKARVEEYRKEWDKDLKKILEKEENSAQATAFTDKSPFNLASICVLARMHGKTMLLTGDARGDFVMEGLEEAELLTETERLHVDVLKVPHHGSDRNVKAEFFERITAAHYVISGDGEHGNPDRTTLNMIQDARGDDEYTIHFTFTENAHEKEKNQKRKAALKKVKEWVSQKPEGCDVKFQDDDEEVFSVYVDLLEPLYEEE